LKKGGKKGEGTSWRWCPFSLPFSREKKEGKGGGEIYAARLVGLCAVCCLFFLSLLVSRLLETKKKKGERKGGENRWNIRARRPASGFGAARLGSPPVAGVATCLWREEAFNDSRSTACHFLPARRTCRQLEKKREKKKKNKEKRGKRENGVTNPLLPPPKPPPVLPHKEKKRKGKKKRGASRPLFRPPRASASLRPPPSPRKKKRRGKKEGGGEETRSSTNDFFSP